MLPLVTAAEMKEAEATTIRDIGLPELVLMEHAALAVVRALRERFGRLLPETRGVIVAGGGNNGGDALAVARILAQEGPAQIFVVLAAEAAALGPSSARQLQILGRCGVPWSRELTPELLDAADWIVDGLFGTGLSRPLEGPAKALVELVNRFAGRKWIVAVDLPSGLAADTGVPLGAAVEASQTVTFGFVKRGLVTGLAADYVGALRFDPIQIPRSAIAAAPGAFLYGAEDAARLPQRRPTSHKGTFGHVFVLAGPPEKEGAALLSARGALRAGAGLVTVAGAAEDLAALRCRAPAELMTEAFTPELFRRQSKQVAVVGPGLGTKSGAATLDAAIDSDWDLVLDADALTLLAESPERYAARLRKRGPATVLTPHPKEAARLLGGTVDSIQQDRYAACRALADRYGTYAVLKGKGTLVGGRELPILVVTAGNTALSTGGTGDVLTGVLAALLAQKVKPAAALPLAVYLHGRAAEIHTQRTGDERSALTTELADELPAVFRELAAPRPPTSPWTPA